MKLLFKLTDKDFGLEPKEMKTYIMHSKFWYLSQTFLLYISEIEKYFKINLERKNIWIKK